MPTVKISYSIKSDAKNWVRIWRKNETTFGKERSNIVEFIPKKLSVSLTNKSETHQIKLVKQHLQKQKTLIHFLKLEANTLQTIWTKYEKKYFLLLKQLTNKPIVSQSFKAELTTASLCPYDPKHNWFMVGGYRSLGMQITTIAHELLHLQFIRYYQEYCLKSGLTESQFEDLKEALTVLLNEGLFKDVIVYPDKGYQTHKILRGKIRKDWRKNKNFDELIKKMILKIKKDLL